MDTANAARKGMHGTASSVKHPKALKISQKWMMGTICVPNVCTSMRKRMMTRLSPPTRIMKARLIGRMYVQVCPETKNWALPVIKQSAGDYLGLSVRNSSSGVISGKNWLRIRLTSSQVKGTRPFNLLFRERLQMSRASAIAFFLIPRRAISPESVGKYGKVVTSLKVPFAEFLLLV